MPFSEETVTETVLLDLAAGYSRQISVLPLNKPQEGKIGADWEWCFYDVGRASYLRFLVQAKVLDDRGSAYSHIDRTVGNTGRRQIDVLQAASQRLGIPAFYAFYNHADNMTPRQTCSCIGQCVCCWGITVAPMEVVREALPDKSFARLAPFMEPWACLLCSPAVSQAQGRTVERVQETLSRLQRRGEQAFRERELKIVPATITVHPPTYFSLARELTIVAGEEASPLIEVIAEQNPEIDGIVLVNTNPD